MDSLEHLRTCTRDLVDIYGIFDKDILRGLRSLDVTLACPDEVAHRDPAMIRPIPPISDLSLPALENLSMDLRRYTGMEWASVEPLLSSSVIPKIRRCTLLYELDRPVDLQLMFSSPLFDDGRCELSLRFAIRLSSRSTFRYGDQINLQEIRTGRHNVAYCEYVSRFLFDELKSRVDALSSFRIATVRSESDTLRP